MILEPDHQNHWLYYKWRGFLLMEELQNGYNAILELVEKEKFTALLADHSSIVGPWNEVVEWLANEWTPRANQAGLKHFAIKTANDLFSNISLELFMLDNRNPAYKIQVFEKLPDAQDWLKKSITPLLK